MLTRLFYLLIYTLMCPFADDHAVFGPLLCHSERQRRICYRCFTSFSMTRHVIRVAVSRYSSAFLSVFADDHAVFGPFLCHSARQRRICYRCFTSFSMTRHVIRVAVSRYSSAFLPVFADDPFDFPLPVRVFAYFRGRPCGFVHHIYRWLSLSLR